MRDTISTNDIFVNIISSALNDTPLKDDIKSLITEDMYEALYNLGEKHHITHIIADVLLKEKVIEDDDFKTLLRANVLSSINKSERILSDIKGITTLFEEFEVFHIPLKGSIIREYYPKDWYRSSSDIDILVKKEELQRAAKYLVENYGCRFLKSGPHDMSFETEKKVTVELHFCLIETDVQRKWSAKLLEFAIDRATPKPGYKYLHLLCDEDFYIYHIAHMAKHFERGGCGVRSVMDLYLMDKVGMYSENTDKALKDTGLKDFCMAMKKLYKAWFEDEPWDDMDFMAEFIINGGVFGSQTNKAMIGENIKGNKIGYILSRIFMPYSVLKTVYPVLCKHKWLYPIYTVRRWFQRLIFNKRMKDAISEVNYESSSSDKQKLKDMMEKIGL